MPEHQRKPIESLQRAMHKKLNKYGEVKPINTKSHHFRDKVLDGTLQNQPISTTEILVECEDIHLL
jgi:hypothetical protein